MYRSALTVLTVLVMSLGVVGSTGPPAPQNSPAASSTNVVGGTTQQQAEALAAPSTQPTPRAHLLPAAPPPQPKQVNGAPCLDSASACVDLSSNKAWLIENGAVIYGPVKVSHGRKGYRTPSGTFKVEWKDKNHKSRQFDLAPMPYAVFFGTKGIAFHQGSTNVLSHGCVRLPKSAAQKFFSALSVGDQVQVVE